MARLRFKSPAEERFKALPPHIQDEIELGLLRIAGNPHEEGSQLLGRLSTKWRKRISGYRVVYRIVDNDKTVIVDAIGARPKVYGRGRR